MTRSIFDRTSFFTLNDTEKATVRGYAEAQHVEGLPNIDTTEIFRHQVVLSTSLDFYGKKINKINPASFKFMSPEQRRNLEEELFFAFYIFSARYQLDHVERRGRALADRGDQIKKCALLINTLRGTPLPGVIETPEQQLMRESDDQAIYVRSIGLTSIVPLIVEMMREVSDGHIKTGLDWVGAFNERRLYWVWAGGGGLLGAIIGLLSDDFFYKLQAQKVLAIPMPFTGTLSWLLYYIRFGVRLGMCMRHTLSGPWMDIEEENIPWQERFMTQWQQRKFFLMNDFFWASANLACFFWLVGSALPVYYGGLLTGVLLIMDVTLSIWGLWEESAQYHKDMERYRGDILTLTALALTRNEIERPLLEKQIKALYDARRQCKLDWDYKMYGLYNDAMYAISLFFAFSLVCCCFFPPFAVAPATALICGVAGTVLCFTMNSFFAMTGKGIKVSQTEELRDYAKQDQIDLLRKYKRLGHSDEALLEKKQFYLDFKLLQAESTHQQQVILYQKMTLLRAILIDVIVPPLVFIGLVFLPMGIGLPILAAGLALAVGSYYLIEEYYKVDDILLPAFDEAAFDAFDVSAELASLVIPEVSRGFFASVSDCLREPETDPLFRPNKLA